MDLRDMLISLKTERFTNELKQATFDFYNSMVGKSKYFGKRQNPKTACGSCIQNVQTAIWKWYHYDESAPTFEELEFKGRLGIHNRPLYGIKKK